MYSIGKISELAAEGKEGCFMGRFLGEHDPWFSRNLEVAQQCLNSDTKADVFSYAYGRVEQVIVVLRGCLRMEAEGQKEEFKQGEIIFVKPKTPIKIIGADDDTELLVIKSPSLFGDKYFTNGTSKDTK